MGKIRLNQNVKIKIKRSFQTVALPCLLLAGCSSPQLKVLSEPPGAEVFASQQGSQERRSLGKTPLDINYRDLREKAGFSPEAGDFFVLTLETKDNEPEKVLVPTMSLGLRSLTVRANLGQKRESKNANAILQRMHLAQKFAQSGDYERAHIECDKIIEADAHIVRAMSLKASIFYLQKNYKDSMKWYEKALAEDGSFDEAIKMIAKIKQEHP